MNEKTRDAPWLPYLFVFANSDIPQSELHGWMGNPKFGSHHIDKAHQRKSCAE